MGELDNIDISKYSGFAFTRQKNVTHAEVNTYSGYINFDECDFFEIFEGTIIAFNKKITGTNQHYSGFHDVKVTGEKIDYIQLISIDTVNQCLVEEDTGFLSFYVFLNSTPQEGTQMVSHSNWVNNMKAPNGASLADAVRCDYGKLGGSPFYTQDHKNPHTIKSVFYVASITGVGHIIKINTSDKSSINRGERGEYTVARTLAGMYKLIMEWANVSKPPFLSTEPISIQSQDFLSASNLGQEVIDDLNEKTGDMPLARYIRGNTERSEEIELQHMYDTPDSLKIYFKEHCLYQDILTLDENIGLGLSSQSIKNYYKTKFELVVFKWLLNKEADIASLSTIDDLKKYVENNLGPNDYAFAEEFSLYLKSL